MNLDEFSIDQRSFSLKGQPAHQADVLATGQQNLVGSAFYGKFGAGRHDAEYFCRPVDMADMAFVNGAGHGGGLSRASVNQPKIFVVRFAQILK